MQRDFKVVFQPGHQIRIAAAHPGTLDMIKKNSVVIKFESILKRKILDVPAPGCCGNRRG
jgi:hypothetical protein